MSVARTLLLIAAIISLGLLSACSSRQSDFYMLSSTAPAVHADHMPRTTLVVEEVVMPGYLDRNNIVVRDADGGSHLAVASFNIWAEPLQQGMQRVLAQKLTEPLLKAGITVLPYQSSVVAPMYAAYIELVRLDADRSGRVALESRWTLIDVRNNQVLDRGSFAAQETVDMPSFGSQEMFRTVVDAQSRLIEQFGDRLASLLQNALAGAI